MDRRALVFAAAVFIGDAVGATAAGLPAGWKARDNMATRKITGTGDWATYTVVLDVPQDAAEIHFGIFLDGRGRVWADDFTFEVVGKDVKTTSMGTQRQPRRRPRAEDLLDHPVNLGFEEAGY